MSTAGTPRRVLHTLPDLRVGGGTQLVANWIRLLDPARYTGVLCHVGDAGNTYEQFESLGIPLVGLGHSPARVPLSLTKLVRLIRAREIDIIHVHSKLDGRYAQSAGLICGIPVVMHLHGYWPKSARVGSAKNEQETSTPARRHDSGRVLHNVLKRARAARGTAWHRATVARFIAVSAAAGAQAELAAPVTLIYNGVDTELFDRSSARERLEKRSELGLEPDDAVIISIGQFVPRKQLDLLVPVLRRVREANSHAKLVLVGDGPQRAQIERDVDRAGLGDHVRLVGARLDVPELLSMADVFVFPSRLETFGLVVVEAMASAKPIVVFETAPFTEILDNESTGMLVPRNDVEEMARQTSRLLAQPQLARQLGNRAQHVARDRFDVRTTVAALQDLYDDVVRDHHRGAPSPSNTTSSSFGSANRSASTARHRSGMAGGAGRP